MVSKWVVGMSWRNNDVLGKKYLMIERRDRVTTLILIIQN